ncbi:MAG: glycosyltransferase [Paracoccaceae bacterium]|nr:glycosyltransferase [Paracoccaceae bacterium]
MSLALAIPVKDDHASLAQLLRQARRMGIFDQVVIVDDGSDPAIDLDAGRFGPHRLPLTVLRNDTAQGPGPARNRALDQISTEYLVYIDSDDRFAPDFPQIWRDAAATGCDLCLFRHHDTRQERIGRWGQMPQDDGLWQRAGLGTTRLTPVTDSARAYLAETANYPWNKIYRTDFLRQHGLGCGATLVHEDIPLHWMAMLKADRVLASSRVGVVHRVAPGGTRLTNRRGAERLEVFDVLRAVIAQLMANRSPHDLVPSFLRFASGLFEWIRLQLDPALAGRYRAALRGFLIDSLTPALEAELARRDPVLAQRLAVQMADGALPERTLA